ncbi:MAG: crossover junction endodeoxyribonuclease RuvC [Bacteroidetes bacterium]|nr:crossover junction endodeoxyribonuclease RuvC [Bacteroidota bacterium]
MSVDKIILGIDPGTTVMGYGAIHIHSEKTTLIGYGAISFRNAGNQAMKLKRIFENSVLLMEKFNPDEMSIEMPFYGKNVQSMFKLGRAQGVVLSVALSRSMPVFEYSPKKIKLSVTGNGNATKFQVAGMVKRFFCLEENIKQQDATDAIAAALCHFFQMVPAGNNISAEKRYKNWNDYLEKNPEKVFMR